MEPTSHITPGGFEGARAWQWLVAQAEMGPRPVGSNAHRECTRYLMAELEPYVHDLNPHTFTDTFFGTPVTCHNIVGTIHGRNPRRKILIGSHFDTRPLADEDPDAGNHCKPVPGANDGASGIAVLLEIARLLSEERPQNTIEIVFFDAEDWHQVDGKTVSYGAQRFVEDRRAHLPDEVVIIDMVGGADMELDLDLNSFVVPSSAAIVKRLFTIGQRMKYPAFTMRKRNLEKYIICDHTPFLRAGIPGTILIDIDYPPWHTVNDLVEHCDPWSLCQVGEVLLQYLADQ